MLMMLVRILPNVSFDSIYDIDNVVKFLKLPHNKYCDTDISAANV